MSEELKVHAAAEAHYCSKPMASFHSSEHGPMVVASEILDAFKAGYAWQAEQPLCTTSISPRAVPRMPSQNDELVELIKNLDDARFTNIKGLSRQAAHNYKNLMAKLEEISKAIALNGVAAVDDHAAVSRMFGTVLKTIDNNVSDQSGRHKAITGALVETQNIIQDVGQKVEAVLDQVTPHDNGPYNAVEPEGLARVPSKALYGLDAQYRQALSDQNADNEYMRGFANGIICAHGTIFNHEPNYIDQPADAAEIHAETVTVGVDLAKPVSDQTALSMKTLTGWNSVTIPDWAGEIREIREFGGRLYACCTAAIFAVDGPLLIPLRFVDRT